jgi:thioredoxin 1
MLPLIKFLRFPFLLALLAVAMIPARSANKDIYPAPEQAKADLSAGLKTAAASHRRVILDFGGNWCGDCQVLDIYFHDPTNKPILDANYVLVHVNIGRQDENLAIAGRYQISPKLGVPALAVLDEHGKLVYSQTTSQFKSMRKMESSAVTEFLIHWKPTKPGCSAVQINC